jgi:putative transcriptional regulator
MKCLPDRQGKEGLENLAGSGNCCEGHVMKRNLFSEITECFEALAAERQGKITLKRHDVEAKPAPVVSAEDVLGLRNRLNLSRALFARYLRINERTLENWEQGRAHPNAQAVVLIRLVEQYPDTVDRLATIN